MDLTAMFELRSKARHRSSLKPVGDPELFDRPPQIADHRPSTEVVVRQS
jgi:hypothetical protein